MKLISKCEKQFVSNCIIKRQKRLDGREFTQGRTLEIVFGKERGCCMVLQGNTRVLVKVSCEISEPKASTPNDGIVYVNLEISPMAAPDAKSYSRTSEEFVEAQRSIERCVRDSKCVELETLCIIPALKVWTIRVDIHALNDDGNLTECASIAAISALAHFKRPQVTATGSDITVLSEEVSLSLRHMPVNINLALFDEGKHILVDPNEIEEKVCDGCYVYGMNAHQEICFVHRRGVLFLKEEAIRRCEDVAIKRVQEITQKIRSALDDDAYKRLTNAPIGFANLIQTETILESTRQIAEINLGSVQNMSEENEVEAVEPIEDNRDNNISENKKRIGGSPRRKSRAIFRARNILEEAESAVFEGGRSKWGVDGTDDEISEEEMSETKPSVSEVESDMPAVKERVNSDSEEETVYINKEQVDMKTSTTRRWFTKNPF